MNNKLVEANIQLVDLTKTLKNDIEILERRIKNAKEYCERNNIKNVVEILDGEEIE